jgi:hypothetical protein
VDPAVSASAATAAAAALQLHARTSSAGEHAGSLGQAASAVQPGHTIIIMSSCLYCGWCGCQELSDADVARPQVRCPISGTWQPGGFSGCLQLRLLCSRSRLSTGWLVLSVWSRPAATPNEQVLRLCNLFRQTLGRTSAAFGQGQYISLSYT